MAARFSASGKFVPPFVTSKSVRRKEESGDGLSQGFAFAMTDSACRPIMMSFCRGCSILKSTELENVFLYSSRAKNQHLLLL
jgi:hypothetical protein